MTLPIVAASSDDSLDESTLTPFSTGVGSSWLDLNATTNTNGAHGLDDMKFVSMASSAVETTSFSNEEAAAEGDPKLHTNTAQNRSSTVTQRTELEALSLNVEKTTKRTRFLALLVVLIGAAAAAAFLALGITSANQDASDLFLGRARTIGVEIGTSWRDYETAALWIQESCRDWRHTNYTRDDFALLYEFIRRMPLDFYGMEWVPNITHDERASFEQEGKRGWKLEEPPQQPTGQHLLWHEEDEQQQQQEDGYTGFMGQEPDPDNPGELMYTERSEQPFYFPIH
ncbi:Histidine kinase (Partial), partial [Seminavis robusta]|eukprot:Sro3989_g352350.1 Histidine kinase (284) ;mRNA; f:2801-3652